MSVWLEQHLQRISHVQKTQPAGRIERVQAGGVSSALRQERVGRDVLGAAGGVVADFLRRLFEAPTPQGQEVGGDELIVDHRRWLGREAFGDDLSQAYF